MQKSILVIAAVVAAATLVKAPAAEARGLRIGFGFGLPFARPARADDSILRRAEEAQRRVNARERQVLSGGRSHYSSHSAAAIHASRQAAAKARAEKAAQAAEAARQARLAAAAAKAEAAAQAKARKAIQTAKPATLPNVAAAPAAAAPIVLPAGDKALEAAQLEQKQKAEQVLKSLAKPAVAPVAPAAETRRQAGSEVSPLDTGVPAAPVAPATVKVVAPAAAPAIVPASAPAAAPIPAAPAAECLRFIPGAGVTVKVPCSE
jgi:colicin import membrane protein